MGGNKGKQTLAHFVYDNQSISRLIISENQKNKIPASNTARRTREFCWQLESDWTRTSDTDGPVKELACQKLACYLGVTSNFPFFQTQLTGYLGYQYF